MEAVLARPRREGLVIWLVCAGHFFSHFYYLSLPPMFPLLKAEFGVSYAALGLVVTGYNLLGGLIQAPIGFLVDRLGPRRVLFAGLGLNAVAITCMGFVDAYWMLLVLAVFAGLGNSVFHPADYAIMSGSISERRLGRAFSIHTFAGFLGTACAPVGMLALAGIWGWRTAFVAIGIAGLVTWALMLLRSDVLDGESRPVSAADRPSVGFAAGPPARSGIGLLLSPPVLLFLAFFFMYGMTSAGLSSFTVAGLIDLHGVPLDWANAALTGHLFGVAGGVLVGGVIADRFRLHGVSAALTLLVGAAFVLVPVAVTGFAGVPMVVVMTVVGLGMGAVMPPRDLMIRDVTPPGESGKVFGFVFVGLSVGASTSPLLFGWLLDNGLPWLVFALAAAFLVMATVAICAARLVGGRVGSAP